ncbi:hypothetical protein D3C86_1722400 [compost metagenome]
MLTQGNASGVGHAVAFFPARGIALNHFAFFQKGQGRVDDAGAGAVGAVEHVFNLADQVVAVAWLLGDQRQQQQFQIARGEDAGAASAALAAGPGALFEAVAAVVMVAVGGMMVSHFCLLSWCLDTT